MIRSSTTRTVRVRLYFVLPAARGWCRTGICASARAVLLGQHRHEAVHLAVERQRLGQVAAQRPQRAAHVLELDAGHLADQPVGHQARQLADQRKRPGGWRAGRARRRSPSSSLASSIGMSAGSFCRSPSIVTSTSPRDQSMPACSAAVWPKLRRRRTTLTRSSRAARSSSSRERAVGAAVVDEDDLVVPAGRAEHGRQLLMQRPRLSRSSLIGIRTDSILIANLTPPGR